MIKHVFHCGSKALSGLFLFIFFGFVLAVLNPSFAQAQADPVTFSIGDGFSDVIPRQIVRTKDDRVFIFAGQGQYNSNIVGYWTTAPGLPSKTADFNGTTTISESANIISVDTAYDGLTTIHVLTNTQAGEVKDYPFDTKTNSFRAPTTLATNGRTVNGDYIGSAGVSGMFDTAGKLHIVYWTSADQIVYQAYTYSAATNALTPSGAAFQLDAGAATANHPILAVSPADNSVTVAWISEAGGTATILARTLKGGTWGGIETVSAADVWTSTNFGINIDQGPSLLIDSKGTRHLAYVENYDATGDYGRVHYVTRPASSTTWTDKPANIPAPNSDAVINNATYSHDPVLAINGSELYIIGHGPQQTSVNANLYTMLRNANGTWTVPKLFRAGTGTDSFDSSASVKWSVVGFNRPTITEFVYFLAPNGNYNATVLQYGRFGTAPLEPPPPAVSSGTAATVVEDFDPAISKIGFVQPDKTGAAGKRLA